MLVGDLSSRLVRLGRTADLKLRLIKGTIVAEAAHQLTIAARSRGDIDEDAREAHPPEVIVDTEDGRKAAIGEVRSNDALTRAVGSFSQDQIARRLSVDLGHLDLTAQGDLERLIAGARAWGYRLIGGLGAGSKYRQQGKQ